jgi:hypothetical protein
MARRPPLRRRLQPENRDASDSLAKTLHQGDYVLPPDWLIETVVLLEYSGARAANYAAECPLSGVKRTSRRIIAMSAFDPKRT